MLLEYARYHVRDIIELHDLAVDDRVRLEVLETEVQQLKTVALPLKFNGLYGTGTNVESYEALFRLFEHNLFIPHNGESTHPVLSAQASPSFSRSRQAGTHSF